MSEHPDTRRMDFLTAREAETLTFVDEAGDRVWRVRYDTDHKDADGETAQDARYGPTLRAAVDDAMRQTGEQQ